MPTPLVGRAADLDALRQLLESPPGTARTNRLISLTGPPGVGKTSLALTVAHELADRFRYGVFLIDLSPVDDPNAVATTIADHLSIRRDGDRSPVDQIVRLLRDRSCLLVLDNFEQVAEAAPVVAELLAACPNLVILVTSRVPLRLRWELDIPVEPLALPDMTERPGIQALADAGAVALFVERARAVQPRFTLTPESASLVGEVCVALDGLPLAIELAAARARTLPLTELHAGLVGGSGSGASGQSVVPPLELLADGARDLPPRQRSLRAAIAWSYQLLEPAEQQLLRRLAVFVGGATFEAATTVCEASWEMLRALVDHNLVHYHPYHQPTSAALTGDRVDSEPRLRLLETVRQFGIEQLRAHGEWPAMQDRHARFFLDLAEQSEPELLGARQTAWLDRLTVDHDNLRAATTWAAEQSDAETVLRFGAALWRFWWSRGDAAETRERVGGILALASDAPPTRARAQALHGAGVLARLLGDYQAARAMFEESRRVAETLGDQHAAAIVLNDHGRLAYYQGDYVSSRMLLEASLVKFRALGPSPGLAQTLSSLGQLTYLEGDFAQSRSWSEQGLQTARQLDDQRGIADALHALGLSYHVQGAADAARQHYEQCLPIFEALGDRHSIAMTLCSLGSIATLRDNDRVARNYYRAALLVAREAANRRRLILSLSAVAALIACHDPERAVRLEAAAELSRGRMGVRLASGMQVLYETALEPARASLSEASRAAAITNGRSMSLDQAVDEALTWLARDDETQILDVATPPELLHTVSGLVDPLAPTAEPPVSPGMASPGLLTRRERDVAALLARGLTTNREIATALVITEGTAANYVQRVLSRLDLRTRAQVAAWAAEHHLHNEAVGA